MNEETLIDFITGKTVVNTGAEANRQAMERFLVERKGYLKADVAVDPAIRLEIGGSLYRSVVDLVVSVPRPGGDGLPVLIMAIKCAAGSLGSREREILSAARLANPDYQIPFAVATDGATAIVLDTLSGKKRGEGLDAIPSRQAAMNMLRGLVFEPLPADRREKEMLIFRSYDSLNVNVHRV